ncbi:hypothetical protein PLCT1_02650 [Planctomycetaceae bacterium]|nr:hypothetical protein PLCT1_02650 [Planctomycetaceae bacterium]
MNFAAFIRDIERRLIGYLRFATLDAGAAEDLFLETCAELRRRWPRLEAGEHEAAAFEIARAAVRGLKAAPIATDELSTELAALGAGREAACMAAFGPKPRESELGRRLLQAAPAPSLQRRMRVTRSTWRSLVLVALSLCVSLALVAGFAALHSLEAAKPAPSKPRADWLGEQITEAISRETTSTFYNGALVEPAAGEAELLDGLKLDFEILVPAKLPRGFRLESIEQTGGDVSGLGYTVLRLNYAKGDARLTILQAERGFPWHIEFTGRDSRQVKSTHVHDTAALVISNAFAEEALKEIAQDLTTR